MNSQFTERKKGQILAVDPGSYKSGIAILNYDCLVVLKKIINKDEFEEYLDKIINSYKIEHIVLGDGTHSEKYQKIICKITDIPISSVDEAYTTVEAEERYRNENSKWWSPLLSFINWKPSEPVDDYVAVILAERFLEGRMIIG
ncbi:MAG: Holliday junction resolvase RuvX [Halanaerobiaceae bacterium]